MTDGYDAPIIPLEQSLDNSRTVGEYYRNLANNYDDYSQGVKPWPYVPDAVREQSAIANSQLNGKKERPHSVAILLTTDY